MILKVLFLLSYVFYATAHTTLFYAGANGKVNDRGVCIVPSPKYGNAPVLDLDSEDMRCRNDDFSTDNIEKCPVAAGTNLTVVWRHIHNSVKLKVMSSSHNGPCIIMMAPLESNGKGDAWFKIYEEGYDASIKKWCTNKVIDDDGYLDVRIPENIPSGNYLVRTELFALPQPGTGLNSQHYPNCVVISVTGGKGTELPKLYSIPGIYKFGDPGVMFDRGKDPTTYPFPGPPLFLDSSTTVAKNVSNKAADTTLLLSPSDESSDCLKKRGKTSVCLKKRGKAPACLKKRGKAPACLKRRVLKEN